jgi:hypothetical protein
MFARFGKSALRLGLSLVVVIPPFLAMISSASASEEITCIPVFAPGESPIFTYEFVRTAGPNTWLTEHVYNATSANNCTGASVMEFVNRYTVYANGNFHARGWGTFSGTLWNGHGFTEPGSIDVRVVVNGMLDKGIIEANFYFQGGSGGYANLHGRIREVIDLRAGTDVDTASYHFDP